MGSVCGQFRFAGRFDPIETKSFGLIRKFRCGMSIQMANFQARDFDHNRVAIVGVCWFGSQDCGLIVVLSCDFEQKQARSIKFCVKNSVRHIGFRTWASTESQDNGNQCFTGKLKGP
jgi:hypothetical protein